jgi:phage shock protein C
MSGCEHMANKKLYRSGKDRIIGGVCGGLAEYFDVDVSLVRLAWIVFTMLGGSGVLAYIIAWLIIPRNPNHKW